MTGWTRTQLSFGTSEGRFHAHSYYDIPVIDPRGRVLAHRTTFTGRHPAPDDAVEVGLLHADEPGRWDPLGRTTAWSWQQGPMAQWIADGAGAVWNDREEGRFVARLADAKGRVRRTLPRPVYAVDPAGEVALGLDMARLDRLRPGYGYAGGVPADDGRSPVADGVWRMGLADGTDRLILPIDAARRFVLRHLPLRERLRHAAARYHYWFNHAKIAPDGARFTVKLRWRRPGGPWNDMMGASLTARTADGGDLRLLADATSHVIWRDAGHLYFWRRGELALFADTAPRGTRLGTVGAGTVGANVHIRHLPPGPAAAPDLYVHDTPYREEVELRLMRPDGASERIATFANHVPHRGPFRCDLHPCPDAAGGRIVVTTLADGGRQVVVLSAP